MSLIYIDGLPNTPIGDIWIAIREQKLVALSIGRSQVKFRQQVVDWFDESVEIERDSAETHPFLAQISAYFAGETLEFTLPIDWHIFQTFQAKALKKVLAIPAGRTRSYGDIARELGDVSLSRAVGTANASNPIPLVIPCHRVIGSDGKLHGYSGANGLDTKAWLLHHEGAIQAR